MEEQTTTTTEGTVPRCHVGSRTDHQCPREATVNPWRDGPPEICELHHRLWWLDNELGQHKTARFWLGTYEQQAEELGCEPLTETIVAARGQADSVIACLEREVAEEAAAD